MNDQYDAIVVGARCGGAATGDAAGAARLSRDAGRPSKVPWRHFVNSCHPRSRRGGT
jgi:hypothetical protein